jgi:hypothetical protein
MSDDRLPDHWPEGLRDIHHELASRRFNDLAEAQRFLDRRMAEYNDRPQAELGDVSPAQAHAILTDPWDGTGPLRISEDLPYEAFAAEDALMVLHAQHVLAFVAREGPIRLTPAGYLPRKVVARMLDELPWRPGFVTAVHAMNKVVNEADVGPLLMLRDMLAIAGLVAVSRGDLRITRKGRALSGRERIGAVAARLFHAVFRGSDFLVATRFRDEPALFGPFPLMLRRLARLDDAWRDAGAMAEAITPSELRAMWPSGPYVPQIQLAIEYGVLRPLADFGLVAVDGDAWAMTPVRFRRTALFPQFLTWTFDQA